MKNASVFICFFSSLYWLSCIPEKECIDPFIRLTFTGFKLNEVDTFIIKKFKLNTEFKTLVDTSVADMHKWGYYFHKDTTEFSMVGYPLNITAGYDWEIAIPSNGNFYRINNIRVGKVVKTQWEAANKNPCYNTIYDLMVNEKIYSFRFVKDDQQELQVFLPKQL